MTPEQKEKNKQYLLDHFEEYVIDGHDNFVNVAPDTEGDEWFFCFERDKLPPGAFEEIKTKFYETILREIKDWKLVFEKRYDGSDNENRVLCVEHKPTKRRLFMGAFGDFEHEKIYRIIGELGHRKNIWKNYEKIIKNWDGRDKQIRENEELFRKNEEKSKLFWENHWREMNNNNTQSSPKQDEFINWTPPKFPKGNSDNNNNPNKEKQNSPLSNQTNQTTNNTPSENQSDSDKAKSEITNNPNLTDSKEKQKAQELLKIIISAESLVKETKFDQEILTKLMTEKDKNSSLYQMLNKEKRIDKAISQLEDIEKKNNNSNSVVNNGQKKNKNSFPLEIILIPFGLLLIVGIGIIVFRKKKKRIKLAKKKKV